MAQLIISAASTVAGAVGQAGVGAAIARTAAATAASFAAGAVERAIFGPRKRTVEGPRLESFTVQASTEGAGVLRVYGRARVSGQIIWAANFKETRNETTETQGGKGGPAARTTTIDYRYSISFAVGLCEGVIDRIGRVWADGKPLDLSRFNFRLYHGTEDQTPDAAIDAIEGRAPAFRGLAYIVFEDMPLADFGNRIPQLSFEVEKRLARDDDAALENAVTAVTMIPGSGEFVYGTTPVLRQEGEGVTAPENVHNNAGVADFAESFESLRASLPNVRAVSLINAWFGDDLRAGQCTIRPGVDAPIKETTPYVWTAGGATRESAHLVSTVNGAPAYGGTPADRAVIEAIRTMTDAGVAVMMHPFILMDIPLGNALPDPYGGGEQAAHPWRGRITAGANDGSPAAAGDIAAFFGTARPADFSIVGDTVSYAGPEEWSFRRFILHQAYLAKAATQGGAPIEAFIIGSELRGVTTARSGPGAYPAVAAMIALAHDVRAVLGPSVKISYGADWSEYFGHQPADGSGDVYFHLDPFWADPVVDFIGVDNYMPLADWRDGFTHRDAEAGFTGPHERAYLQSNIEGGEGYDWFYLSADHRDAQTRSPISDGAYGEDWIFRYKDLRGWWENPHHNRPGGVRDSAPTAWVPRSKPFRFTEAGAAAIDKAANQPNVFIDPKSAESAAPYYSNRTRDDLAQRRFIEAIHAYWRDEAANPVSPLTGAAMIDIDRTYVYCWDARPFPFFPALTGVWGDGGAWATGHWLNGRAGRAPLDLLVEVLAGDLTVDTTALEGVLTGYIIDRPLSPRAVIDPLADIFQFDMVETSGLLRFQQRGATPSAVIAGGDFAVGDGAAFTASLRDDNDLPAAFRLGFIDEGADYGPAVAEARDPALAGAANSGAGAAREAGAEIAAVMPPPEAEARARSILADASVMRETATFSLAPSALALEPGDTIALDAGDAETARLFRITDITDRAAREIEAVRVSPSVYDAPTAPLVFRAPQTSPVFGAPIWALMDLPLFTADADEGAPYLAAFSEPWPDGVALYRAADGTAPVLAASAPAPTPMGRLESALPAGASGRWDRRGLRLRLNGGVLASRTEEAVFAGANAIAVETAGGGWEILQFQNAALQPDQSWVVSRLLRGQAGTESEAASGAAIGARVVVLGQSLVQPSLDPSLRGIGFVWSAGPVRAAPESDFYTEKTIAITARGLTPYAPVHLSARREPNGARLRWIRRTRRGGDSWEGEAPLAETSERYQVTIYNGAAAVRTVETGAPEYFYASDAQAEDFPDGAPGAISFGVRQWSDAVGWGVEARC